MKVAFHTLGCKVNQNDTNNLMALFQKQGYQVVPFGQPADVYVVNTCAVTHVGERKSRQTIRKAIQNNPEAVVAVTGCYAQTAPEELAGIPGVNLVVGMADRPRIVDLVAEFRATHRNQIQVRPNRATWEEMPQSDGGERTRATLKIEEGCDQYCSYCIVPYARGPVRSMPPEQVIQSIRGLLAEDYQEIVLTGIHLGSYGKDCSSSLAQLLAEIVALEGRFRVRLGSIDPHEIDAELVETIVGHPDRICQSLHIPLQSGSDRILKLMNRHYSLEEYAALLGALRAGNPLLAIGTDLIVGFPGETDEDFDAMAAFVREQAFSRVHVFRYSPRRGTPAARLPGRVSAAEQERRSRVIQAIAAESGARFAREFIGRRVQVLFEEQEGSLWEGLSGEYLRVKVEAAGELRNRLVPVLITGSHQDALQGII
ncbi:threonylcarbamoyladenosine tRNA methylthiotransferase MtaB [Hydrogenispora ethanolica]|uniref:Threonylcarbamoyladenosine tRNA methylthiotransferase MtaB n=1 Tax=Hydrogenispora ethanolica TaxID=1082276 RepID=A0A4R1R9H3_HYDET|nr:tRNA (N(6)-L-threonylcarbamoyladenosine(37)-C(2))-methylthiotransferase MtaB [Hydrogenispora ethanolica]TCL62220.1 threonylcarbamoyladenosine tRNA methylthiotransferase MtaB [Hydrogenispora ethanolica]